MPAQLDGLRVDHIEPRAVQPHVVANLPGQQRMLLGGIVANQQNGRRGEDICHAGCSVGLAAKRSRQGSEVRGAVVVHIVRLQDHAGELGEQVSFFIRDARRSDDTDRLTAFLVANFGELLSDQRKCIFPCRRSELAVFADERLRQNRMRNGP